MQKVNGRNSGKNSCNILQVLAIFILLVASFSDSIAQTSINTGLVKIDAVYFAQTHLSKPDAEYFTLVGNRRTLIKAHIIGDTTLAAPEVKAIVRLDGNEHEIILQGPDTLPASFEPDIYKIKHSYDDGSFTGIIPKEWLKAGMTVELVADTVHQAFDSLAIGAPTVLKMNMFEIACFEDKYTEFPEGWEQEFESRIPVSELQVNTIKTYWPEFVMRPNDNQPAKRISSRSESKNGGADMIALVAVLQNAAGANHIKLNYLSITNLNLNVGGLGGGFKAIGGGGGVGYVAHEGGHALGLPHANNKNHPYKEGTYSGIYVKKEWVGPNWGFCLWNEKFMTIYKSENDTYRGTPMLGGGKSDGVYDWALLKHFSDYEVNKMKNKLEDKIVTWNSSLNSWASWNSADYDYTTTVENDGVRYPVKHDVDVVTILSGISSVTAEANIIYPPIGPYNTGLIRLFDPREAKDREDIQIIYSKELGKFDYTLRINQGNQEKYVLIPVMHDPTKKPSARGSFKSYAVNLPAEDGEVTKVELLLTPDADQNGLPTEETIIADWPNTVVLGDKTSLEPLFRVYPNPVSSMLSIENAPINANLSLIDLVGRVVLSETIEGTRLTLNVEPYGKGIYILTVGDKTSKVIIE